MLSLRHAWLCFAMHRSWMWPPWAAWPEMASEGRASPYGTPGGPPTQKGLPETIFNTNFTWTGPSWAAWPEMASGGRASPYGPPGGPPARKGLPEAIFNTIFTWTRPPWAAWPEMASGSSASLASSHLLLFSRWPFYTQIYMVFRSSVSFALPRRNETPPVLR